MAKINRGLQLAFLDSRFVNVDGDAMIGPLTIKTHTATAFLVEGGGGNDILKVDTLSEIVTLGGTLDMSGHNITNIGTLGADLADLDNVTSVGAATYNVLQYIGGVWTNQQDLQILGAGNIILKAGQKLIFDGA